MIAELIVLTSPASSFCTALTENAYLDVACSGRFLFVHTLVAVLDSARFRAVIQTSSAVLGPGFSNCSPVAWEIVPVGLSG